MGLVANRADDRKRGKMAFLAFAGLVYHITENEQHERMNGW